MAETRLDQALVKRGLVTTRSQAENYIKLSKVEVAGKVITKPGYKVKPADNIRLLQEEQYVSRAALKLASVSDQLKLDFDQKIVLDVGSSTGGFTDYALQHGATKVIAVDVGTEQMHPKLQNDPRLELHEKTDIRKFKKLSCQPDIVLIDVSFISLRQVLPSIARLVSKQAEIIAMLKPQFEAGENLANKGVVKNNSIRRQVLKDFEAWATRYFVVVGKSDSSVPGAKGNLERFYKLRVL